MNNNGWGVAYKPGIREADSPKKGISIFDTAKLAAGGLGNPAPQPKWRKKCKSKNIVASMENPKI